MTEILAGPVIITRYLGPTNTRPSRVVATHKRDSSRSGCHPWRAVVEWNHELDSTTNHKAAAEKLLASWPIDSELVIAGRGHDADAYYWLTVGRWQLAADPATT
jgi:hypothetical protein